MSSRVTADWTGLMAQASSTSEDYVASAWRFVVKCKLGNPWMDKIPNDYETTYEDIDLAIKMAKVSAMDFHSSCLSVAADKLSDAVCALGDALDPR